MVLGAERLGFYILNVLCDFDKSALHPSNTCYK